MRELQQTYIPVPESFFERIVAESCKLPARLWREVVDGLLAFDDAADLRLIEAPTLIQWGENDPLFPPDEQHGLLAAIPDAQLRTYAETGHCPNWERPEQLTADLEAFIRRT